MAKKQKPAAPPKKYTPDEVLDRFRAKDDPELGRYAKYAASHRAKLAKISEKEKARQEKEQKLEEERKKQFEKAMTPEQLYQDTAEAAVYDEPDDDSDMPSKDIKGKIFSNYQPLSAAPPRMEAPKSISAPAAAAPASVPKLSMYDLTRRFNQKFSEPKKEQDEKKIVKKSAAKKVTKKLVKKKSKSASVTSQAQSRKFQTKAPPLPPAKNVDPKYVKQQQEALKKQQEKEEKEAEQKAKAEEKEAAKKEAEKTSAADRAPQTAHHHNPFKTGFWIMCGVFAFLIILVILFFLAVVAISYLSGVPIVENGTIILP